MAGATATGEIGRIDSAQSHGANAPKGGTRGLVIAAVVAVAAAFGVAFAVGSATKGSTTQTNSSQLAPVTATQGPQKVSITAVGAAPVLPNLKSPAKPPPAKPKTTRRCAVTPRRSGASCSASPAESSAPPGGSSCAYPTASPTSISSTLPTRPRSRSPVPRDRTKAPKTSLRAVPPSSATPQCDLRHANCAA